MKTLIVGVALMMIGCGPGVRVTSVCGIGYEQRSDGIVVNRDDIFFSLWSKSVDLDDNKELLTGGYFSATNNTKCGFSIQDGVILK